MLIAPCNARLEIVALLIHAGTAINGTAQLLVNQEMKRMKMTCSSGCMRKLTLNEVDILDELIHKKNWKLDQNMD